MTRSSGIPASHTPPDLEHVPTLAELHREGLARATDYDTKGKPTRFQPSAEGQTLIYAAMKRNARRTIAWQEYLREGGTP